MSIIPNQPMNPTPADRYKLTKFALEIEDRPEDFDNIIELLSPPPDITTILPPGSCKNIRVAIIGGGMAGLSAAFELRKLGYDITIFEAEEKRIGGRIYTYYFDKQKSLYGELGAMRMSVSHETTWHYLDLFRLNTRPFVQTNENAFKYVRGIRVRNDPGGENVQECIYPAFNLTPEERNTPWPELEEKVYMQYLKSIPPEIRREILEVRSKYSPPITNADIVNLQQMMLKLGLSEGAIEMLSSVDPFIGAVLYQSYFEILAEIYPVSFSFVYEIIGGMVKFPEAFVKSLLSNKPKEYLPCISTSDLGKIHLKQGYQVTGLSQYSNGDTVAVEYTRLKDDKSSHAFFDYVVCTIPFSNLRLLNLKPQFSTDKMQAIKTLTYVSSQKTLLLFNCRFWEAGGPNQRIVGGSSTTDQVINTIWYPSDQASYCQQQEYLKRIGIFESPACMWDFLPFASPNRPGVLLASYNWTQDAIRLGNFIEPLAIDIVERQVEEVHGLPKGSINYMVVDSKRQHWNRHPWSLGAFAFYDPGQKTLFSKVVTEPEYSNRVFFAGEHISVSRQWIQGALQTGMLAANEVAKACRQYIY